MDEKRLESREERKLAQEIESLTIHGPARILSADSRFRKVIWSLIFLASFACLVALFAQIVMKHNEKDVYTKVNKTFYKKLPLPAITFCNTNLFVLPGEAEPKFQEMPENCTQLDDWRFANKINKKFFEIGCKLFFGNSSSQTMKLALHDKTPLQFPSGFSFLPHAWPCFTLNRNSFLEQYGSGERKGLHMILYHDENVIRDGNFSNQALEEEMQGLFVDFHDPKEHFHAFNGIILPPGYHTHITLRKYVRIRKQRPFKSDCVKDGEETYRKIVPGKHTVDNCFVSCLAAAVKKVCLFRPPFPDLLMPPKKQPGDNLTEIKAKSCQLNVYKSFTQKNCNCQLPCYEEIYETKTNRNPWPQEWKADIFSPFVEEATGNRSKSYSIEHIRRKLVKLSVYYEETSTIVHEEKELYSIVDVLSNMGGQMGLLLGASCISLLEVIVVFFDAAARWLAARGGRDITRRER